MAKIDQSYIIIEQDNDLSDNLNQYDDKLDEQFDNREKKLNYWKNIPQCEQKSIEWIKQRSQFIGGSEAGCLVDENPYEPYYKLIVKKLINVPFLNFSNVYIGNKYEDIAIMLYEYLKNVKIDSYGFLPHLTIPFVGASPDGITNSYKYNGINKSNKNGRLVEIKCAVTRKINMKLDAKLLEIVPRYYYPQVQQQMETCDLDETDFWQIKIIEYDNFIEFKKDTSDKYPFKSKDNKFKGAIIQILPIDKFEGLDLNKPEIKQKIYANAKFIMPPNITLSPNETKQWIIDVRKQRIPKDEKLKNNYKIKLGFTFHKAFYWKVDHGRCTLVKRDKIWFNNKMPLYQKTWNYITFLRDHEEHKRIFLNIVNQYENGYWKIQKSRINEALLNVLDTLYNKDINSKEIKELITNYELNKKLTEDDIFGICICNE